MAFDQDAFFKLIAGDRRLFAELYQLYHQEWPTLMNDLEKTVRLDQSDPSIRTAHRLKGMTRNFFAAQAADLSSRIEDFAVNQKTSEAVPLLDPLRSALKSLDEYLLLALETLND